MRDRRATVSLDAAADCEHGDDALARLIDTEERQRVVHLIAALPDEQRELIVLRVAGELSTKEIARVVGKNEGAVRVAIHRIVQQLRVACAEELPLANGSRPQEGTR